MKRKKNLGNKGFSLVELIIVISIMAILIGVVGTQVIPYLEKSRQANDSQIISTVGTAVVSSFATQAGKLDATKDYTIKLEAGKAFNASKFQRGGTDVVAADKDYSVLEDLAAYMGFEMTETPIEEIVKKMESKKGKTLKSLDIDFKSDTGVVTVQAMGTDGGVDVKILETVVSK